MDGYDIIVIGGGVNSMIVASLLGEKGKKVLVLEARDEIGGLASTSEFAPGFKCNLINDVIKWIENVQLLGAGEILTNLILRRMV